MLALLCAFWIGAGCAQITSPAPARLLVKPAPGVSLEQLDQVLRAQGARRVGVIDKIHVHIAELAASADAAAVVAALSRHPQIEFVEIDTHVPPGGSPKPH